MRFKLALAFILLFSLPFFSGMRCYSQQSSKETFSLDGLIYGYKYEASGKLLQKDKQAILEGVLPSVQINITEDGRSIAGTTTNKKGEFEFKIATGKVYRVEFSKTNYLKNILIIDLRSIPAEMTASGLYFTGAEIIMNSFKSKETAQNNLPFGKLFYNTKTRNLDFEAAKSGSKKGIFSKKEETSNSAYLMRRAVNKNKDNLKRQPDKVKKEEEQAKLAKEASSRSKSKTKDKEEEGSIEDIETAFTASEFKLEPLSGVQNYSESSISNREAEIAEAMKQLEIDKANARTPEDSLLVMERENLLNAAMTELQNAKSMIEMQQKEISVQRKLLFLVIFCLVLVCGFVFMLYKHNKEKRRTHLILKESSRKIAESITYASRIQRSILLQEEEVQKVLPDSFIYYEPRDVVSGDFYWLSEQNDKIIVATVDCTGHGVPGAFMALIGNTLMNEIVNEKRVTKPSQVLKQMNEGVMKALRQKTDGHSQDGMEMSLCVIDRKKKTIECAGAMNPIYFINGDRVEIVKPDMISIGGALTKNEDVSEFKDHLIPMEKGTLIYMFTDGYMDQFGGTENKKFNTKRFKEMLLEIRSLEMSEQKNVIAERMKDWRKGQRQIDDMLVLGIKC